MNDVPVIKQQVLASKQSDATNTTYGAGGKKSMERNEFTKTYCDTNVYKTNKAITAITRDSLYQAQKQEAIDKFKGFQQLDINQVSYRCFFNLCSLRYETISFLRYPLFSSKFKEKSALKYYTN